MNVFGREEGLKVPRKQPKRGRLYLNDGSCLRLRACWPNHVWSYDFVADRLANGKKIRLLTIIDEYKRKCLGEYLMKCVSSDNNVIIVRKGLTDGSREERSFI